MLPCACSVAGDPCGTVGVGLTQVPAALFIGRAHVPPPQSCRGTRVTWHSPKGGWEGRVCGAVEQLVLVSVPVAAVFSLPCHAGSPCLPSQPGISNGGRAVWSGKLCPALPAAHSQPFSSQMLYMK